MFGNLGFASADNYMWSETFLILLAMGRNILFLPQQVRNEKLVRNVYFYALKQVKIVYITTRNTEFFVWLTHVKKALSCLIG